MLAKAVGYKPPRIGDSSTCSALLISTALFREQVQTLRFRWNKSDRTLWRQARPHNASKLFSRPSGTWRTSRKSRNLQRQEASRRRVFLEHAGTWRLWNSARRGDRFARCFERTWSSSVNSTPPSRRNPRSQSDGVATQESPAIAEAVDQVGQPKRVRQFLDTCFVMMPFGSWFDRYYQEIYVPAIREAGFEPVRLELFHTGSVVEQIGNRSRKL